MPDTSRTFPPFQRWQSMSESEQDALLDKIETRRRWIWVRARTISLVCCVIALAVVTLIVAQ